MNRHLEQLQPYPFERLRSLFADLSPARDKHPLALSIGEPRHPSPAFVLAALSANVHRLANYPTTAGMPELRQAICDWLRKRYALPELDTRTQVVPLNGTREGLFSFAQTVIDASANSLVLCPNPFYQIYEGAALLAGARPAFINCSERTGFLPDFDAVTEQQWRQCRLLFLCSPGNPTGAVLPLPMLKMLIDRAREYDFVIASDECYAEIYPDEADPPPGLLQACIAAGNPDYKNCVVFHSLSKRSSLPGLRSGFAAGDAAILRDFLLYRTYHGCAMPIHHQLASIAAWRDEAHVRHNRRLYAEKFTAVLSQLAGHVPVSAPAGGFYLWPKIPVSDTDFARQLFTQEHVTVLPGRFLARPSRGVNPGENRLRLALVPELADCIEAAQRIARCLQRL